MLSLVVAVAYLWWMRKGRVYPQDKVSQRPTVVWWSVAAAPMLGTALIMFAWLRGGGPLSLVLRGDMVWNTAQSLFIHADGGVSAQRHPNPAPLTNLIFATSYGTDLSLSLGPVLDANAVVVTVLALIASTVSGLYIARQSAALHPFVRACLVFAVGWIPYTGGMLGGVIWQGHANLLTSYILVWFAFVLFGEPGLSSQLRTGLLLGLSTVVAASWAPLVIVSLSLAVVSAIEHLRVRHVLARRGLRSWVLPLAMLAQFGAYVLLVTLPDLRREGSALSQDGGVPPISECVAIGMALMLAALTCGTAWASRVQRGISEARRNEVCRVAVGVGAVLLAAIPTLAFLLWQRVDADVLWGYYPVKFVSMLVTVISAVLVGSIAAVIMPAMKVSAQIFSASIAVPVIAVVTLAPFAWTPSPHALAPSLTFVMGSREQRDPSVADQLLAVSSANPSEAQIVLDNYQDQVKARLINSFLIQLEAEQSTDPIRAYAYVLDTSNTQQVCDLMVDWNREVTVWAPLERVGAVEERLNQCTGASNFVVRPLPSL